MSAIKVLLVDKRQIFLEGLAKLLEHVPELEVLTTCSNGLEAVDKASKLKPDVILMDTEAECQDFEATRRIGVLLPETKIIMLTHSEEKNNLLSALKAGARGYLSKDISLENLVKSIVLAASGELIISPCMVTKLLEEFSSWPEDKQQVKTGYRNCLSPREEQVLALVAKGASNKEIAMALYISEHTAKVHLRNIMEKLHVRRRHQAVAKYRGEL